MESFILVLYLCKPADVGRCSDTLYTKSVRGIVNMQTCEQRAAREKAAAGKGYRGHVCAQRVDRS